MIIEENIGPSVRDRFTIDRSHYLNQISQSIIYTAQNHNMGGHSAGIKLRPVLKAAVGEFVERHSLLLNYKEVDETVPAFRLINGDIIDVSAQDIVFVRDGKFNDSCGVGSHLNSTSAIEGAFFELFERQSFIFNWLTCSSGQRIAKQYVTGHENQELYNTLHSFVDDVYLFEISLHEDIYVILGLGIGEFNRGIGLAAHVNLERAIHATLSEMLQSVSNNYNKREVTAYEEDELLDEFDIYQKEYASLTPQQLLKKFDYLFNNSPEFIMKENRELKDLNTLIKTIERDLSLEVYGCFIEPFYKHYSTKIVKIFSKGGYPHMDPSQFDEETTHITFNRHVEEFPNAYKITPFP